MSEFVQLRRHFWPFKEPLGFTNLKLLVDIADAWELAEVFD